MISQQDWECGVIQHFVGKAIEITDKYHKNYKEIGTVDSIHFIKWPEFSTDLFSLNIKLNSGEIIGQPPGSYYNRLIE